jgi:hypothetical protein
MARIFVSHAHEDKEAAHQIAAALTEAGLEPWLDVQELRGGDELLRTIAEVLAEAAYFAIALTPRALTKPWVLAEMRMALTREIEQGQPKVVVLLLEDCEVPIELRHKIYLDFRGRFDAAVTELADHLRGVAGAAPMPKQTILAEMIRDADAELWARLGGGTGAADDWGQNEAADVIRELRSADLEAAVAIGRGWSGQDYKAWQDELVATIRRATGAGEAGARRTLARLADLGFLEEARDLDYRRQAQPAWCDGDILWILRRAARRSGLFPALPPPLPERLSSLLAYGRPIQISGEDWYAVRFAEPMPTALDESEAATVAVVRHAEPARAWAFRSPDDRAPLQAAGSFAPTDLTPANPFASLAEGRDLASLGFDLARFDDLGLLGASKTR